MEGRRKGRGVQRKSPLLGSLLPLKVRVRRTRESMVNPSLYNLEH